MKNSAHSKASFRIGQTVVTPTGRNARIAGKRVDGRLILHYLPVTRFSQPDEVVLPPHLVREYA